MNNLNSFKERFLRINFSPPEHWSLYRKRLDKLSRGRKTNKWSTVTAAPNWAGNNLDGKNSLKKLSDLLREDQALQLSNFSTEEIVNSDWNQLDSILYEICKSYFRTNNFCSVADFDQRATEEDYSGLRDFVLRFSDLIVFY